MEEVTVERQNYLLVFLSIQELLVLQRQKLDKSLLHWFRKQKQTWMKALKLVGLSYIQLQPSNSITAHELDDNMLTSSMFITDPLINKP